MISRKILLETYKYIGRDYYNEFVITADDMLMNIISYQFAQNFSNIETPGYLYYLRKESMSRGDGGIKLKKIRAINYLLYFKIFYKYIKEFNKDRNYLFYEIKNLNRFLMDTINYNITKYIPIQKKFLKEIINDKYSSYSFKNYLKEILL